MLFQFVLRNIKKRFSLNLIKVVGLALGFTGVLFISLFLKNELTYDGFHHKANSLYRFTVTDPNFFGNAHFARFYDSGQIPALVEHFPEIENYVRLAPIRGGVMLHRENYFSINEAFICDSTFFDLFDAELLVGNPRTVLNAPGSMVVSASFAKKTFGSLNPIGETISIPAGQYYAENDDFTITGIMKDFPNNSHFHPDLVATMANGELGGWAWTYLLLSKNADPQKIANACPDFWAKRQQQAVDKITTKAYLQKITDIHLHSDKLREIEANGNLSNIYILFIAALILLLISMSNYSGLNLGMAVFNNKFLNVNRILGSTKYMNFKYFILESLVIIGLSIVISFLLSIPINQFISHNYGLNLFKDSGALVALILLLFCILGTFAGLQPVLKPLVKLPNSEKNINPIRSNNMLVSKTIIVSQYALAIILIIGVLVISRQTRFLLSNSMGVQKENIICLESVHANIQQKFELFKSELLKTNSVESVSAMLEPPGGEANDAFPFELEGYQNPDKEQENLIGVIPCDYSIADQFNFEFLSGRNFSKTNLDTDGSGEFIINETALHHLNYTQPNEIIGKRFKLTPPVPGVEIPQGVIIGVVKDFYLSNMKKKVNSYVLFKRDKLWLINFTIAFKPGQRETALADIRNVWSKMFPAYPFEYEEVNNLFRKTYRTELLQAGLLRLFTFLSLFICSMGLLGLSLLLTQKRIKEIGIRKVNGARSHEIMSMLNLELLKWIVLSAAIATPVAWYIMDKWLENFAYKTTLSWWIFVLAGLLALAIALLTVSWLSWRTATRNPVEALRYE